MKARIRPHKKGDGGIICLPMYKNVPEVGELLPDWRLVLCPRCGALCWESAQIRQFKKEEGLRAVCTACALKEGETHR